MLEFTTPVEYVSGYLYTKPILLTTAHLGRTATVYATLLSVFLTILNLWFSVKETIELSIIASRCIAAMALIVTGILGDRNRCYQQAIA